MCVLDTCITTVIHSGIITLLVCCTTCVLERRDYAQIPVNPRPLSASTPFRLCDSGEIRLSPADVPLMWVSVLQGITSRLLDEAEERARELVSLEKEASAILRGAGVSRGLSCSKSR